MKFGNKRGFSKQLVATVLAASMALLLQPAMAQPLSTVEGAVFGGADGRGLGGARVHLIDPVTNDAYSATTNTEGSFTVEGVPAAAYDSAVEFEGGLYVVGESVTIAAGEKHGLNLSVPQVAKKATSKNAAKSAKGTKAGKASFMSNPLTAALVVVGSAFSLGVLVDKVSDDGTPPAASPFGS